MKDQVFDQQQWEFLAVYAAINQPVSVGLAGSLAPLAPGPLFDLIRRATACGLLKQVGEDRFQLGDNLGSETAARLKQLCSPSRLQALLEKLERLDLSHEIKAEGLARLLAAAGRNQQAAAMFNDKAMKALRLGQLEQACDLYRQTVETLWEPNGDHQSDSLFIDAGQKLVRLSFRLGRTNADLPELLDRARMRAESLGDLRSKVMIGLMYGAFYYLSDRTAEAVETLRKNLEQARDLGDDDMAARSEEFFGLYYYLCGRYEKAALHLQKAVDRAEARGDHFSVWPSTAYLAYSALMLGQYHKALGIVDANRRRAEMQNEPNLAMHFRALLGVLLALMGRQAEAEKHLRAVNQEAVVHGQLLVPLISTVGLAYLKARQGLFRQAYQIIQDRADILDPGGMIIRQYPAMFLKLLHIFHKEGFSDVGPYIFEKEMAKSLESQNVHLKGVALHLQATDELAAGVQPNIIEGKLRQSMDLLAQSGDPAELAMTRLTLARISLRKGDEQQAREFALKSWEGLSGAGIDAFPMDLRFLLAKTTSETALDQPSDQLLDHFLEILGNMLPDQDGVDLYSNLLDSLCQVFRAERGALFLTSKAKNKAPFIKAQRNLSAEYVNSPEFRSSLSLVYQTLREGKPRIENAEESAVKSICLPVTNESGPVAVFYFDNNYLHDNLGFVSLSLLHRLAHHVGRCMKKIAEYERRKELTNKMTAAVWSSAVEPGPVEIVAESPVMDHVLAMADKAAPSDSTVLITGETGVGKELLARRLHTNSLRSSGPFVAVDLSATPENLFESLLFGHEKGAFTGADERRIGRMEMADGGTLFIDELGEISLAAQVKLLRVLEEKCFTRVGGNQPINSDFRLVAATNRNLEHEISEGRFRRDLYYRLNVIPVNIPPLRERGGDVIILARHMARRFTNAFNCEPVVFSAEDEERMLRYTWPGNVRELKNVIERSVLLSRGGQIQLSLPSVVIGGSENPFEDSPTLEEMQRRYIRHVLNKTAGRIGGPDGAASILGMKRTSLYTRMKKLGIQSAR